MELDNVFSELRKTLINNSTDELLSIADTVNTFLIKKDFIHSKFSGFQKSILLITSNETEKWLLQYEEDNIKALLLEKLGTEVKVLKIKIKP